MSDCIAIPQYSGDFDQDLWLNDVYSKLASIPSTEVKKTECKKTDATSKKIKSKKSVMEPKKIGDMKIDVKNAEIDKHPPNHDNWLGYIIAVFISKTITQSIECCPGCKDLKNSPLFHSHHHSGLLEKLYMFTPSVKAMLVSKLPVLVADYVGKYPDSDIYDVAGQKTLTSIGRIFIRQCNPTFVYYSKYLTPKIYEVVINTPTLKSQAMTLKRVAGIVKKCADSDSKKLKTH